MALEFKKLSEVTLTEKAVDTANVLIEENGEIKRVPKTEVGGSGSAAIIIKDTEYDNAMSGISTLVVPPSDEPSDEPSATYECINATFEDVWNAVINGETVNIVGLFIENGFPFIVSCSTIAFMPEETLLALGFPNVLTENTVMLMWNPDTGIVHS